MALEASVTHIADLNKAWPVGADPKSSMDDHLRNLKTVLLNDFPGYAGTVAVTGTDGGAANAYTLTPATALPGYSTRMIAVFAPTVANTGASTLNVSGLGVKPIVSVSGAALVSGDLAVGTIYLAAYDGTSFRLTSTTKNYVDQLAFGAALPAQAVGFLRSDGTQAAFTQTHTGYAQKEVKGADIVCAPTIDLTTATGNLVHITGSTGPVTEITVAVGAEYTLIFDASPQINHSASLKLPREANLTIEAGDRLIVRGDTSGAVVTGFLPVDGGFATSAEVKAGALASRAATPASLLGGIGFSAYVQTADQTITVAGALTIAHGLGRTPIVVLGYLKCTTAANGYSVGDIIPVALNATETENYGVSVTADSTNLYVRYGSGSGSPFLLTNKTTGTTDSPTPANYRFVLRVFA